MLGLVLGTPDGIIHALPGDDPEVALSGPAFTTLDYRDGVGIAGAPGHGVWMHRGREWEQVWEGDPRTVRISPDGDCYIGTAPPMVYRSTDQGETWAEVENVENVLRHYLSRIVDGLHDPAITGVVFPESGILIGVRPMGTWLSRDGGGSWMPRAEGLDPMILGIWEHPERRDRLYATAHSGFFRSDDGGFSWVQSLSGLDRAYGGDLAVVPGTPDTLVLSLAHRDPLDREGDPDGPADDNSALFRSINGGVAWQRFMLGDEDTWPHPPLVSAVTGTLDMLFVLAGSQAWGSHDRGENWMPVAEGLPFAHALVAAL